MYKLLRDLTLGICGLCLVSAVGCAHKEETSTERSDVSVTDEARSAPKTSMTESPRSTRVGTDSDKTANSAKRTDAAAARNRAAVAKANVGTGSGTGAPSEGSDAEYAADVDAAMGDTTAPVASSSDASSTAASSAAVNAAADNSRVNRLNDGEVGITADQQGNSKSDIEITRKIRKTITDNKQLSTYAHNVKIITRDGRVVLKGPVRSEAERLTIEDTAVTVAGAGNVSSGIEIKAK